VRWVDVEGNIRFVPVGVCLAHMVLAPLTYAYMSAYTSDSPATDSGIIILSAISSLPANTTREDRMMHGTTAFVLLIYQPDDLTD
jgi:hypothetical protein